MQVQVKCFLFFKETGTTEIYTLSLRDALPIYAGVNELNSTIYHEGISVQAPLKDLADGIVNSVILAAATKFHLSVYGLVCPLWVNSSVFGSIGFNSRKPLDQKQRLVCEAFASQAALTLENSRLAEQLSNRSEERRVGKGGRARWSPNH